MTVKKDEDLYEMAIQFKKEEDFAGWYTDVSEIPASRRKRRQILSEPQADVCIRSL